MAIDLKTFKEFSSLSEVDALDKATKYFRLAKTQINRYCKQDFWQKDVAVQKLFNGQAKNFVELSPRCYAVTEILLATSDVTNYVKLFFTNKASAIIYDEQNFLDNFSMTELLEQGNGHFFSHGLQNVKVTGSWGWETVPTEIEDAVFMIAEKLVLQDSSEYQEAKASPMESEKIGDYSYKRKAGGTDLIAEDPLVQAICDDYIYGLGLV